MNQTIEKFGYPENVVGELSNWIVLTRPKQITLGCLVLAEKTEATTISAITQDSAKELPYACEMIEKVLADLWQPQKLNYLALMMVDPNVHFHVIPRYDSPRLYDGVEFSDAGWPKPPTMDAIIELTDGQFSKLTEQLRSAWAELS